MTSDLVEFTIGDDGDVKWRSSPSGPTNVFEWCWEHSEATGDDRGVLLYLAFHAPDGKAELPYPADIADSLRLDRFDRLAAINTYDRLSAVGELSIAVDDYGVIMYRFPAYESWKAAQ